MIEDEDEDKAKQAERNALARTIGTRIRAARLRVKLTQQDVAERIGMVAEVYGRLERGKMLPSVETLRKLPLVLGVSADELLGLGRPAGPAIRSPESDPSPEIRRLVRRARVLNPAKQRLMAMVAGALANIEED